MPLNLAGSWLHWRCLEFKSLSGHQLLAWLNNDDQFWNLTLGNSISYYKLTSSVHTCMNWFIYDRDLHHEIINKDINLMFQDPCK